MAKLKPKQSKMKKDMKEKRRQKMKEQCKHLRNESWCKHLRNEGWCSLVDDFCSYHDKENYKLCEEYIEETEIKRL